MRQKMLSVLFALTLCMGILSAAAMAADDTAHGDHDDWTALTADYLDQHNYTLADGKYFVDGDAEDGWSRCEEFARQIVINGDATLCLYNTDYMYTGMEDAAILIRDDATLNYCCCVIDQYGNYGGNLHATQGKYGIENHGTLNITGGGIYASQKEASAIYNDGVLNITGGTISGSAGDRNNTYSAYGILNAAGGTLNIGGDAHISGSAPGYWESSTSFVHTAPQIDIITHGPISAKMDDLAYTPSNVIHLKYLGEVGEVVTNLTGSATDWTANWNYFVLNLPENALFTFDEANGKLIYEGHSTLTCLGKPVMGGTYYKLQEVTVPTDASYLDAPYQSAELTKTDQNDYDIIWDEDTKTLTMNELTLDINSDDIYKAALFSANCDELTLNLIGKNEITVSSSINYQKDDSQVFENTGGGIRVQDVGQGSENELTVNLAVEDGDVNVGNPDILTAFSAAGSFDNRTLLRITGANTSSTRNCSQMVGVAGSGFDNSGSLTVSLAGAYRITGVRTTGGLINTGSMDIAIHDADSGSGIEITGGGMTNTKELILDIRVKENGNGVAGYALSDEWKNSGSILITAEGDGRAIAMVGGSPLTGMYLSFSGSGSFTNTGIIQANVTKRNASNLTMTNWPSWQYFDTIGLCFFPDTDLTITNAKGGSMDLRAENGYTAGLEIISGNTDAVSVINDGTMNVAVTTAGGENIRSVGIFAQMTGTSDVTPRTVALNLRNASSLSVTAGPATGHELEIAEGACMAICLSQIFTGTLPASTEGLQQITLEGNMTIAEGGSPIVLAPIKIPQKTGDQTTFITAYINTIGTGEVPSTTVSCKPYSGSIGSTAYPPEIKYAEHGKVTVKPASPVPGAKVTLTATPDAGYMVDELTIIDRNGKAVLVTDNGDGTYSFIQPSGRVTITAKFRVQTGTLPFADVPGSAWYLDGVQYVYKNGLMDGTGGTTFSPDTTASRAMIVAILWRLEGRPVCDGPIRFKDVDSKAYYADAVCWAASNNIVCGYGDEQYGSDDPVTREQLVVFLYRYAQYKGYDTATTDGALRAYIDSRSISDYAVQAMAWAVEAGLINGTGSATLSPGDYTTRAQLAMILMRFDELISK